MNNKPRLLLISYDYPPISSPGSIRVSKFAQYLPEHGWYPTVLTSLDGYNSGVPLSLELSSEVTIVRVADRDPAKYFARNQNKRPAKPEKQKSSLSSFLRKAYSAIAFPDRDWIWGLSAYQVGKQCLSEVSHGAIYSTSPNITNHLVALKLKRATGLPWVAEFRDTWAFSQYRPDRGRLRSWMERVTEAIIIREADFILSVSRNYLQQFKQNYSLADDTNGVIYNGFDENDFLFVNQANSTYEKFSIAHAGNFYDGQRTPESLFVALHGLGADGAIDLEKVEIDFYGNYDENVASCARDIGVESLVNWRGYIPYHELLPKLAETFCLLLIVHKQAETLPSKLFDYIGCQRLIIALAQQESEVFELIRENQLGYGVPHEDVRYLKEVLNHLWLDWLNQSHNREFGSIFNSPFRRSVLTAEFANVLRQLVGGDSNHD
jgi:glycosyltransferase involved in cell wall biosynthesis